MYIAFERSERADRGSEISIVWFYDRDVHFSEALHCRSLSMKNNQALVCNFRIFLG